MKKRVLLPCVEDTITLFCTEKKVDWLGMKKLKGEGFKTVNTEEYQSNILL